VVSALIWITVAAVVNGLVFHWLGGFDSAGKAVARWGEHSGRRWARRRGLPGY
jgi:hypothetical protein